MVAVVLYVGMVTLADWEAFGDAVSALPAVLWVQVVLLSLLSYLLRFAPWHRFIVTLGHHVPVIRNLEIYLAAFLLTLTPGKAGGNGSIDLPSSLRNQLSAQYWCLCFRAASRFDCGGDTGIVGNIDIPRAGARVNQK